MKFLALAIASVLAAFPARASDAKPEAAWLDGLAAARSKAESRNRLILLREIHCGCDGTACPLQDLARQPAYLRRESTSLFVDAYFVRAVGHAPKNGDVAGLVHPGFIPADYRRNPARIQTLIVTPTGHVLHRLDLCPHAGDVDAELAFARKIRETCFDRTWAPLPGWEENLRGLHAEHALNPVAWHKDFPAPREKDAASRPWFGYAQFDLAWHPDVPAALEAAKRTDRLVFFYQVVGNLDKEGC